MAVTSTLNIQFLNKPQPAALRAEAKILKAGRRLAVLAVEIYTDEQLVAHATGSYALPAQSDLKK
jgi:acyl-coenzyme A thioesterase PaaI-like protein